MSNIRWALIKMSSGYGERPEETATYEFHVYKGNQPTGTLTPYDQSQIEERKDRGNKGSHIISSDVPYRDRLNELRVSKNMILVNNLP